MRARDGEPEAMITARGPEDRDGFTAWVRPHWASMSRLAYRLAPAGEWEDALQDALTAAWRKRAQYSPARGSARNWLLAIVADQARKRHKRSTARRITLVGEDGAQAVVGVDPDLERALTQLSVRQRTAVELHYYLDLPVVEVAAVMACAPGTVKSTLADARKVLRRALGEDYR